MATTRVRSGTLRWALAALAAGAVAVGVVLLVSGPGSRSVALKVSGGPSPVQGGPAQPGDAAAVARSLRQGVMVVVIDQPSSGLFAEQNAAIDRGASMAVSELNAAGGFARHIRVKLVSERLDGLSAAAVESRLRSDAAAALILPCDTDSQLSLAAEAARYGQLMLAPCNLDPTAAQRYPTYWPVGMSPGEEAYGLTRFMRTLGYGGVFIVSAPGSRYVQVATSAFRAAAARNRIRVVGSASVSTATGDFSSLAHSIKAISPLPSVVFTAVPPPFVNRMAAGLRAQGLPQSVTVLGASAMDTPLTLTEDPRALSEAVFASYGFPRETAAGRRFLAAYKKLFGLEPVGSFPGLGFETIRVLAAAVHQAHSAEPSAAGQALSHGLALEGVALAERRYRPGSHNPVGPVAIEKDYSGRFEEVLAANPE